MFRQGESMTSKVRVNMFPCKNTSEIEVSMTDDGDFIVKVNSSCKKVAKFVEGLGPLSMGDLTDKKESKVFRNFVDSDMSANCLTLSGVLTAAWLEAGMIAKSYAKMGVPLNIELIE